MKTCKMRLTVYCTYTEKDRDKEPGNTNFDVIYKNDTAVAAEHSAFHRQAYKIATAVVQKRAFGDFVGRNCAL